jgi:hypothetical protein
MEIYITHCIFMAGATCTCNSNRGEAGWDGGGGADHGSKPPPCLGTVALLTSSQAGRSAWGILSMLRCACQSHRQIFTKSEAEATENQSPLRAPHKQERIERARGRTRERQERKGTAPEGGFFSERRTQSIFQGEPLCLEDSLSARACWPKP